MTDDEKRAAETRRIAAEMRDLEQGKRDLLIAEGNVLDLRPKLQEMQRQRELARSYRAPPSPKGEA